MVISFSSFQCKRANPPEIKDVIAIRKRRAFGKSEFFSLASPRPIASRSEASIVVDEGSASTGGGTFDRGYPFGCIEPAIPFYVDPITRKQFKLTKSPNEDEILGMFKFYGIDINKIYQCPVCDLQANMREMLPHLNNDKGVNFFVLDGFMDKFESHGWNFKQLGEWMDSLGY